VSHRLLRIEAAHIGCLRKQFHQVYHMTDYVIIGTGFTGIGIARALLDVGVKKESICFISKESGAGGLWRKQGESSRLHHPSNIYLIPGIAPTSAYHKNDNLYCATAAEVRDYAEQAMQSLGILCKEGIVEEVRPTPDLDTRLEVTFTSLSISKNKQVIRCNYAIQATGHTSWAGEPRLLSCPREIHTVSLGEENICGKKCLLIGSGRSAADAVKYLYMNECQLRILYRTPTVFWRKIDATPFNRLYEWLLYQSQLLRVSITAREAAEKEWSRAIFKKADEHFAKRMLHWWHGDHWTLGRERSDDDPRKLCRGAGLSRFEYIVLNMFYHAFGVNGQASSQTIREIQDGEDSWIECDSFPGEKFDVVISATGYKGSSQYWQYCLNATSAIAEPAPYNAYVLGRLLHHIKDNSELVSQWNDFARHEHEFSYFDITVAQTRWAQNVALSTLISGSTFHKTFCREHDVYPASWTGLHSPSGDIIFAHSHWFKRAIANAISNFIQVICKCFWMDFLFIWLIRCCWRILPRSYTRALFSRRFIGRALFSILP
jgi:hypothetical protein